MQKYVLSELDSGQRVISEKVPSVRSVSLGFWIGAGSRDEKDDRAGRLALHRASALQRLAVVRCAADRGDLRRDGSGAQRGHVPRAHGGLLTRSRQARRGGAAGDDGHGLRACVRRARPGARGRARGDRDVRGHAAGARARSVLAGGLRRACARSPRDRHGRGDLDRQPPRDRGVSPFDVHGREHRRLRGREHHARAADRTARALRARGRGEGARPAGAPAARGGAAARPPLPAQGHGAVPRVSRRAGHLALRPPPLCRVAARLDPRRLGLVSPLPGDPREAGDGVLRLQLRVAVHGHRPRRRVRRHARGEPRRRASRSVSSRSARSQPASCAPASSSARRRVSRAASCSRWSRRRTG